jgi:hypothetical protein
MSDASPSDETTRQRANGEDEDEVQATIVAGGQVVGATKDGEPLVEGPNPE